MIARFGLGLRDAAERPAAGLDIVLNMQTVGYAQELFGTVALCSSAFAYVTHGFSIRRSRYQELQSGATAAQHAFVLLCAEVYDHFCNDDEASAEEGDVPGCGPKLASPH